MNNHICKYCHKIDVEMTYDKNEKGMVCFNCLRLIHEEGIIPPVGNKNTNEREGVPGANNK